MDLPFRYEWFMTLTFSLLSMPRIHVIGLFSEILQLVRQSELAIGASMPTKTDSQKGTKVAMKHFLICAGRLCSGSS